MLQAKKGCVVRGDFRHHFLPGTKRASLWWAQSSAAISTCQSKHCRPANHWFLIWLALREQSVVHMELLREKKDALIFPPFKVSATPCGHGMVKHINTCCLSRISNHLNDVWQLFDRIRKSSVATSRTLSISRKRKAWNLCSRTF